MSNFVPGFKMSLSYFEKLERGVRKSNGIEVEAGIGCWMLHKVYKSS